MALRSFAKYNGTKDFSQFSFYAEMRSIPAKKSSPKTVEFLSESALEMLLKQPSIQKASEMRNQFFDPDV